MPNAEPSVRAPNVSLRKLARVAFRWRGLLYLTGWLLLLTGLGFGIWEDIASFTSRRRRYTGSFLFFHAGFFVIVLTMGIALWHLVAERATRVLFGLVGHIPLVVLTVMAGDFLRPNFTDPVCGTRVGCFAIDVRVVPPAVVFEIWSASKPRSSVWQRIEDGGQMNFSEDGSYLDNPHLLLSGNERILVLARGGYFVDALDTASHAVLSDPIVGSEPDREAAMRANSAHIGRLMDENR